VPDLSAVNVNFSPAASTLDSNVGPLLTTVWGCHRLVVQVICVPAFTVIAAGAKLKLSILTLAIPPAATPGGVA
jgi:hypothetical protein